MLPPAKTPSQVAAEGSETSQLPASTGVLAAIASASARARARTWRLGRCCAAFRYLLAIGAAPCVLGVSGRHWGSSSVVGPTRIEWYGYQLPVFGIEAQGSAGGSAAPFCS